MRGTAAALACAALCCGCGLALDLEPKRADAAMPIDARADVSTDASMDVNLDADARPIVDASADRDARDAMLDAPDDRSDSDTHMPTLEERLVEALAERGELRVVADELVVEAGEAALDPFVTYDGTRLYFHSDGAARDAELFVFPLDRGRIPMGTMPTAVGLPYDSAAEIETKISFDASGIAYLSRTFDAGTGFEIVRIDEYASESSFVRRDQYVFDPHITRDGRTLFYSPELATVPIQQDIIAFDLVTETERLVSAAKCDPAVSAEGLLMVASSPCVMDGPLNDLEFAYRPSADADFGPFVRLTWATAPTGTATPHRGGAALTPDGCFLYYQDNETRTLRVAELCPCATTTWLDIEACAAERAF